MNTLHWVVEWFEKNSDALRSELEQNTEENYFHKGWIDSLKFINLITKTEEEFKITFSNDEFQNRKFSTLKGFSEIIEAKNEKI